jgi:hypothetical protein
MIKEIILSDPFEVGIPLCYIIALDIVLIGVLWLAFRYKGYNKGAV